MIYKAKDGKLYKVRQATRKDILQVVKVHSFAANKAYSSFKEEYPDLFTPFTHKNLMSSWGFYFDKCEQDDKYIAIIVEKLFANENQESGSKIVAVSKAGMLDEHYKEVLENVTGTKLSSEEAHKYANFQTIYVDPNFQGVGLGRAVMGYFANHFSKKGCQHVLTETLGGYEQSPKFFAKVGGATCIGDYAENASKAISVNNQAEGGDIPLKLWYMPDINKMKLNCYFQTMKVKHQKPVMFNSQQLGYNHAY